MCFVAGMALALYGLLRHRVRQAKSNPLRSGAGLKPRLRANDTELHVYPLLSLGRSPRLRPSTAFTSAPKSMTAAERKK